MSTRRKNIVGMSDEEFEKILIECAQKGLTERQVSAIIERDCEAVCPTLRK